MRNLTLQNVATVLGSEIIFPDNYEKTDENICAKGVVLDSRLVEKDFIFVATKGDRVDGHSFLNSVFEKGALAAIVEDVPGEMPGPCIKVDNSFEAITKIATYYRECLGDDIKIVGITGSVGKTSTKEFIAGVLSEKYNVLKTQGNFNNEIGVPLTILRIRDEHDIAVVEMGINHFGEMTRLTNVVKPDVVVMTNIGECHLENLGDRDGVLKAKSEIFECLKKDGLVVLNGDDDKLVTVKEIKGNKPVFYGIENKEANYIANDVEYLGFQGSKAFLCYENNKFEAKIPLPGKHMVLNSLAALAVAKHFELSDEMIKDGLVKCSSVGGRSNVIKLEKNTIIDDCYNANPTSVRAAIDLLSEEKSRKVAILGDMFELGQNEKEMHYDIGKYAAIKGIDMVICIGELSKNTYDGAASNGAKAVHFSTVEEFISSCNDENGIFNESICNDDTILIKASHSMGFDKIVKEFQDLR